MNEKQGAWIKTIPLSQASDELMQALEGQAGLYPVEYRTPVPSLESFEGKEEGAGIVMSHSLLPQALYHAFSTFGVLISPDLPLTRRQHEMIAATVSALNRCFY